MNNNPHIKKNIFKDMLPMIIGEAAVALLVILSALALDLFGLITFDYRIITGAALGVLVILVNYGMLIISVDRAVKRFQDSRGHREMTEDEAEDFAKANSAPVQKAIALSTTVRTVSMLGALVLAFLLDWFNPIATAIPLFAFRFLIPVVDAVLKKNDKTPDPSKFIRYEDGEENTDKNKEDY